MYRKIVERENVTSTIGPLGLRGQSSLNPCSFWHVAQWIADCVHGLSMASCHLHWKKKISTTDSAALGILFAVFIIHKMNNYFCKWKLNRRPGLKPFVVCIVVKFITSTIFVYFSACDLENEKLTLRSPLSSIIDTSYRLPIISFLSTSLIRTL